MTLEEAVRAVQTDFATNRHKYLGRVREFVPEATNIRLTGSFATGSIDESSDIDLEVQVPRSLDRDWVHHELCGRVHSFCGLGLWDIIVVHHDQEERA